jgi:hypothetical protein
LTPEELGLTEEPAVPEEAAAVAEAAPVVEEILAPPQVLLEKSAEAKAQLRFAEDIVGVRRSRTEAKPAKAKKKKKGGFARETGEEGVKARGKGRRDYTQIEEDEDVG